MRNDKKSTCKIYCEYRSRQKKNKRNCRLEAFVNNPNIKAISIAAYERSFVVLYEEATSDL